jgi:DNA-binding winged helix-turn-helix (wHTH) protein
MSDSISMSRQGVHRDKDAWKQRAQTQAAESPPGDPLANPPDLKPERNRPSTGRAISFDRFRLLPGQRLLLYADKAVPLGSRALDILIALVERSGELLGKDELMARVWPNTFVEPANLSVHVAALRRALGDGRDGNRFIVNIPGRGYQFVAAVTAIADEVIE